MSEGRLPPHFISLLQNELDSFEKLELMRRLRAAKHAVTRATLMAALQVDPESFRTALAELTTMGLVENATDEPGSLRLGPRALMDRNIEDLLASYEEDRLAIVGAMSTLSLQRIRKMAANTFADAFVIRKKRKDEDDG